MIEETLSISMLVQWDANPELGYSAYVRPADAAIAAITDVTGFQWYQKGRTKKQAMEKRYSIDHLRRLLDSHYLDDTIVTGFWNGQESFDGATVSLSVGRLSPYVSNTFSLHMFGNIDMAYALETAMLKVVELFDAKCGRIIDRDCLRILSNAQRHPICGIVSFLRSVRNVEVSGFHVRRHRDGVVYVMDSQVANSSAVERAEHIANLSPLAENLFAQGG